MERNTFKDPADIITTRPTGRTTAPLVINRNGSRKDLFGTRQQQSKDRNRANSALPHGSHGRSGSGTLSPDHGPTSPNSRIPRPNSNSPRPLGIKDAYRMAVEAEEKEAAEGSPSPAPRTWRSRLDAGDKTEKSPSKGQGSRRRAGGGRPATAPLGRRGTVDSVDSLEAGAEGNDDSDNGIEDKIQESGKVQQHREMDEERLSGDRNGLFANARLGPKVEKTGKELSRKTSNSSLDAGAPSTGYRPWGLKAGSTAGMLARAMSAPEKPDVKLGPNAPRNDAAVNAPTPNKSFAWDADADFTAGDLLVSNSPPVKTGKASSPPRYRNTKLDEIRALEIEAELKYPDEPPEPADESDPPAHRRRSGSVGTHSPPGRPIGRTNTKLDEIRAREIESLSRRAVATARLDEIRERNAEARSDSASPEIPRKSSSEAFRESPLADDRRPKSNPDPILAEGEQIPDTPVTIFRKVSPETHRHEGREDQKHAGNRVASKDTQRESVSRVDSHDLLRRLARAASTSPAPEQQTSKGEAQDVQGPSAEFGKEGNSHNSGKERNFEKAAERPKTVGFAGLRKEPSAESLSERLHISDNDDATERIEREMLLFAPMDNHSERGSVRAPSPESDLEDDVEETPRPVRIDPLSQPTPKVTGAYIDTPATVKVERLEDIPLPASIDLGREGTRTTVPLAENRGRKVEISLRKPSQISSADGDRHATRAKSQSRSFQRASSLPRARSPLINSVRPPTVKDVLLEIQRTNHIEDSTLDDLEGFLTQDMSPDTASEKGSEPAPIKIQITESEDFLTDEKNSKAINRIGRSLESIRTARKGIERLEDEVSKAKEAGHHPTVPKPETTDSHHLIHPDHLFSSCPICQSHPPNNMVAYVHVPLPRLWRRSPTFRFTLLGLILSILSLWYLAESTMCALYCKPEYCYPGKPCVWSPDDPFWGYALPVKLDQWTTGGQGRQVFRKVRPEVEDWIADVWDGVTGTDIRRVDTRGYDWEQRRQHRRRMMKKGLVKPFVERPEDREKYGAWRRAREAKERADARREMGYETEEEVERMVADERVR